MRNEFERQMEQLNGELTSMGKMCEDAVDCAMKALFEGDMNMAQKAFDREEKIDQKEKDIESLCMKLLLRQQPVARDLRLISAALKMISDMERIGDQAEDIAEILEYMQDAAIPQEENLRAMAETATSMVTQSVESFVDSDLELAYKVIDTDDTVDEYFIKVKEDLIAMIAENPEQGGLYLDLLMIAKYLERVADHATNIGEWVVFSITGKHFV